MTFGEPRWVKMRCWMLPTGAELVGISQLASKRAKRIHWLTAEEYINCRTVWRGIWRDDWHDGCGWCVYSLAPDFGLFSWPVPLSTLDSVLFSSPFCCCWLDLTSLSVRLAQMSATAVPPAVVGTIYDLFCLSDFKLCFSSPHFFNSLQFRVSTPVQMQGMFC